MVTASDGEEAWTQLQTAQFNVVVSDLKMPRLDGIELLKRIKQGRMADMAVIMMTAYGSIPVAVEAMRLGAFDFVTKPFRNEDLFPLLARLDARAARRARRHRRRTKRAHPIWSRWSSAGRRAWSACGR